jgi:hypothetical protein
MPTRAGNILQILEAWGTENSSPKSQQAPANNPIVYKLSNQLNTAHGFIPSGKAVEFLGMNGVTGAVNIRYNGKTVSVDPGQWKSATQEFNGGTNEERETRCGKILRAAEGCPKQPVREDEFGDGSGGDVDVDEEIKDEELSCHEDNSDNIFNNELPGSGSTTNSDNIFNSELNKPAPKSLPDPGWNLADGIEKGQADVMQEQKQSPVGGLLSMAEEREYGCFSCGSKTNKNSWDNSSCHKCGSDDLYKTGRPSLSDKMQDFGDGARAAANKLLGRRKTQVTEDDSDVMKQDTFKQNITAPDDGAPMNMGVNTDKDNMNKNRASGMPIPGEDAGAEKYYEGKASRIRNLFFGSKIHEAKDASEDYEDAPQSKDDQIKAMSPDEAAEAQGFDTDSVKNTVKDTATQAIEGALQLAALAEEYEIVKDPFGMPPSKDCVLVNKLTGREIKRGTKEDLTDLAKALNQNPHNDLGDRFSAESTNSLIRDLLKK